MDTGPRSSPKCRSPFRVWIKICSFYNYALEKTFEKLGKLASSYPYIVILICVLIVAVMASGFAFMKVENRTEQLYIPQDSVSLTNLKKAEAYGFYRPSRLTEVILLSKSGTDALTKQCFEDALSLHNAITNLTGYTELCLPTLNNKERAVSSTDCATRDVLKIFNYSSNNFEDIVAELNKEEKSRGIHLDYTLGQVLRHESSGEIVSARAIRLVYLMLGASHGEDVSKATLAWEESFLERMRKSGSRKLLCGPVYYTTGRSLDDAIQESTVNDTKLISITFMIMITFACLMLGKYRNPLTGHGLLAMSGVMAVGFGIMAAFGVCMHCRLPFISIIGILPFLIVGVGIDDMFIIVDELDRSRADQPIPARLSSVMRRVGPAITMTTMTDLLAFAVGTTSRFPSVVYFCTYAALAISFAFLFLVTIFVAYMTYDCRRMNAGRRDMVPCLKAPPAPAGPDGSPRRWDEPVAQTSNKIMEVWGKILMKPFTKGFVVVLSLALLVLGIYGSTFISEEFDRKNLAKDGSEFLSFLHTLEAYFTDNLEVDIILESGVNYSDPRTQEQVTNLSQIIIANPHYRPYIISWLNEFQKWPARNASLNFTQTLHQFLVHYPWFRDDITFARDNATIHASRIHAYVKQSTSSIFLKNAMTSLRGDLSQKSSLPVFASAWLFIFFEQFVLTFPETVRNLALAAAAILLITTPFLVNPLVVLLVIFSFASLIFELLGLMYVWDVSLNSISMINLVMAIGFAVDYSAHVAHFFVFSHKNTPEEKVIDSLKTVGASVFMGGFSTFLGMVVTAFASAEIFRIFFKMFFGIVVLGLLHGLCFLPVWLAVICRQNVIVSFKKDQQNERTNTTMPGSSAVVSPSTHNGINTNNNDSLTTMNNLHHKEVTGLQNGVVLNQELPIDHTLPSSRSNPGFEAGVSEEMQRSHPKTLKPDNVVVAGDSVNSGLNIARTEP